MPNRNRDQRGNAVIEFSLVGIPIIFVLISTFEMARGMWLYHTVAYAVKEGSRYASVHGQNCRIPPNNCPVDIGQISQVIKSAGLGIEPALLNLTFTDDSGTTLSCTLSNCLSDNTPWPPAAANAPGMAIKVSGSYTFRSAIAMFWPGSAWVGPLPALNLPASTTERIKF